MVYFKPSREETPDFQSVLTGITKMPIKVLLITIIKKHYVLCICYIFNCSDNIPDILVQTCFYIAKDKQGMSFIKVMAESIKLMKGNKMAWFKLRFVIHRLVYIKYSYTWFCRFYSLPMKCNAWDSEFYDFIKGKKFEMYLDFGKGISIMKK